MSARCGFRFVAGIFFSFVYTRRFFSLSFVSYRFLGFAEVDKGQFRGWFHPPVEIIKGMNLARESRGERLILEVLAW